MIAPVKVEEIIKRLGNHFEIVQKYETIDAMWGIEHMVLTNEDIKALIEGKYLYHSDGEYAHVISYCGDNYYEEESEEV